MGQFDPVKNTLDSDIWNVNHKLKNNVRLNILTRLMNVTKHHPVKFISLIFLGSMTGYQYKESSDIDVQVVLHPTYDIDQSYWHQIFKKTNGYFLDGTLHPINFFVLPSVVLESFSGDKLSSAYDLIADKWVKFPTKPTYSELHQFDSDQPLFIMEGKEIRRQLAQYKDRPTQQELEDIADEYMRWDSERKSGYAYPGYRAGGKNTFGNAMYKYLEKLFGEKLEALFHKYYDPIAAMRETP